MNKPPKSELQEICMKYDIPLPTYTTTATGPSHKPTFTSSVNVDGRVFFGSGAKRVEAESNAAVKAIDALNDLFAREPLGKKLASENPRVDAGETTDRRLCVNIPKSVYLLIDVENLSQFPALLKKYNLQGNWKIVHSPNFNEEVLSDLSPARVLGISSRHRDGADIAIVVTAVSLLLFDVKKVYIATKDLFAEALKDAIADEVEGVVGEIVPVVSIRDLEELFRSWT